MKFTKKQMDDWGLPNEGDLKAGVKVIEDIIYENSRWSIHHHLIFSVKDKFYQTSYSVGATEYQDEGPWEYDNEVECEEIHQVEKIVKVWEKV